MVSLGVFYHSFDNQFENDANLKPKEMRSFVQVKSFATAQHSEN